MNEENIQTSAEDVQDTNLPETEKVDTIEANNDIDYKIKFSESSKEALRIREENIRLQNELAEARKLAESNGGNYANNSEQIIPGFEHLSEEEQKNLIAYTESIRNTVKSEIYKDPAIANAKRQYNESVWNEAFNEIASNYPELKEQKDDFKSKYFREDNVPSNIKELLGDVAKVYLFDKAREIGAKQALEQANRIDLERASGGDKEPSSSRTLEDWQHLQRTNPAQFAKESAKFNEDLKSGKL